jgi:FkbM family methyltransferase
MNKSAKLELHRDVRSPLSFARLMFSRSGLLSKIIQTGFGFITRLMFAVGATNLGELMRRKRMDARDRYRSACDRTLDAAVTSGLFKTYVDLGAHKGEQVLEFGQHLSVVAFEPDPRAFEFCTRAVRDNPLLRQADIQLHQLAVSDFNGKVNLSFNDSDHCTTGGSTIETTKRGYSHLQHVEVEAIDILDVFDLVKNTREAIFKIDIEGAEYRVLQRLVKHGKLSELGLLLVEFHERKMKLGVFRGSWLTLTCWFHGVRRSRILEWYYF